MATTPSKGNKTSPGGRSVFNDAMSPRPKSISLPSADDQPTSSTKPVTKDGLPDMNEILRTRLTSPTHMHRFDSADYFMQKDFPSDNADQQQLPDDAGQKDEDTSAKLVQQGDYFGGMDSTTQPFTDKPSYSQRQRPSGLEHRWATRTSRPAEIALNSPHPAGPRAIRKTSLVDVFAADPSHNSNNNQSNNASDYHSNSSDMNLVLRAKLAGKSRLRRFDSADYFLNHETGELEARGLPEPVYGRREYPTTPPATNNNSETATGPTVSPIQTLEISTNVGTRSRSNSRPSLNLSGARTNNNHDDDDSSIGGTSEDSGSAAGAGAGAGVQRVPSPFKMQRSKPRALQPGRQERAMERARLGERAEIAARVPQSPSDNYKGFFRKKMIRLGSPRPTQNTSPYNSPTKGGNSSFTTPTKGSPNASSLAALSARRRSNSRAMPSADSMKTKSDIRKAALHSRLSSQGKALYQ